MQLLKTSNSHPSDVSFSSF